MAELLLQLAHFGYILVAVVVFAGACGLPMPVTVTLLAAGVACAHALLRPELVLVIAVAAGVAGDALLFYLGRGMGWFLLGNMCRLSVNPEACILRSAEFFYRHGRLAVVFAKFIPGLGALAAPLAGSMKMRPAMFLRLDALAAVLYTAVYCGIGLLLGDLLTAAVERVHVLGVVLRWLVACGVLGYIAFRALMFWRQRTPPDVPRIGVEELAAKVEAGGAKPITILDVRSHGYYDPDARRIRGSLRVEPNNLLKAAADLPRDAALYLYCT